jgi:hypothetical protein
MDAPASALAREVPVPENRFVGEVARTYDRA